MKLNSKEELTVKEILKRKKVTEEFNKYQLSWLRYVQGNIEYGNKKFKNFAVDPTQVPCLLIMLIIDNLRETLDKEMYNSLKYFLHEVLEGNIQRQKPKFKIVKNDN